MRRLIYVIGGVAAVVLVVTVAGYALPQNHVASREALIPASPASLFQTILDVAKHPEWRSDVTRVEVLAQDPLKWREYAGGDVITFEVVENRPPERLRVRIADHDLPFGGTWTYELAPEASATRLRITEHGEVYNPIFRLVSRFVFGHTATIDRFIEGLQARVSRAPREGRVFGRNEHQRKDGDVGVKGRSAWVTESSGT
jgi:uncharacterized protein YndB with AHSA1/START domain